MSCSQELVTGPYPQPDESNPHHTPYAMHKDTELAELQVILERVYFEEK
jgi:hypothetical protein